MPQAMPKANQISSELIDILASKIAYLKWISIAT